MAVDVIWAYLYVDILVICPMHHALMDIDTATEYNSRSVIRESEFFEESWIKINQNSFGCALQCDKAFKIPVDNLPERKVCQFWIADFQAGHKKVRYEYEGYMTVNFAEFSDMKFIQTKSLLCCSKKAFNGPSQLVCLDYLLFREVNICTNKNISCLCPTGFIKFLDKH